jgi:hypothetical protein
MVTVTYTQPNNNTNIGETSTFISQVDITPSNLGITATVQRSGGFEYIVLTNANITTKTTNDFRKKSSLYPIAGSLQLLGEGSVLADDTTLLYNVGETLTPSYFNKMPGTSIIKNFSENGSSFRFLAKYSSFTDKLETLATTQNNQTFIGAKYCLTFDNAAFNF